MIRIARELLFAALLALFIGCAGANTSDTDQTGGSRQGPNGSTEPTTPNQPTGPTTPTIDNTSTQGSLKVELSYYGPRSLSNVEVRLLDSTVNCDGVPWATLPDSAPVRSVGLTQIAAFDQLQSGKSFRIVALSRNASGFRVAAGCYPDLLTITPGSQNLRIVLADILPAYTGKFQLTYTLDLTAALPKKVKQQVEMVLNTIQNPGLTIVDWLCELEELANYCGDESVREAFGAAITELVMKVLESNDSISPYVFGANDLITILTQFKIESQLEFKKQPDVAGNFDPESSQETIGGVRYRWTLGADCDPNLASCGVELMDADTAGLQSTPSRLQARVHNLHTLHIERHSFEMKLGQTLGQLLEKSVLPRLLNDEKVDSFESFIKRLLGGGGCLEQDNCCDRFGERVEKALELLDFLPIDKWAEKGCNSAVKSGAKALRKQLEKLDSQEGLLIGTPKQGCQLHDGDDNMTIDTIGTEQNPCAVDALIQIDGDNYPIPGTFHGKRL